jgi:hypothetical protein
MLQGKLVLFFYGNHFTDHMNLILKLKVKLMYILFDGFSRIRCNIQAIGIRPIKFAIDSCLESEYAPSPQPHLDSAT